MGKKKDILIKQLLAIASKGGFLLRDALQTNKDSNLYHVSDI